MEAGGILPEKGRIFKDKRLYLTPVGEVSMERHSFINDLTPLLCTYWLKIFKKIGPGPKI
jgi:hypothetical protein